MGVKELKHGVFLILFLQFGMLFYSVSLFAQESTSRDTLPAPFRVAKTAPEEYEDMLRVSSADLRTPENVKTTIEYDIRTGCYVVHTRLGGYDILTPIVLTAEEYLDYSFQQSVQAYYRQKNEEEFQKEADKKFNLTEMQFDIGAADRIFGPGGVRVRTQGTAEVELGLNLSKTQNPSLSESVRK